MRPIADRTELGGATLTGPAAFGFELLSLRTGKHLSKTVVDLGTGDIALLNYA